MRRGRGVATVLLAVSAASAAGAAHSTGAFDTNAAPSAVQPARTAVLSPRRAPAAFTAFVADTRLAARLRTFAESLPGEECLVVESEGRPVFSHNPSTPLIPASTMKLVTARASAIRFGGDRSGAESGADAPFSTEVFGAKPDADGVVAGDLVLEGGGDPLLMTPEYAGSLKRPVSEFSDFTDLVTRLRDAGVRRVTGRVVGSDDRFDEERYVPTWKPSYAANGDVGPVGALAVNDGFVRFGTAPVAARDPALAAAELLRASLIAAGVPVDGPAVSEDPPRMQGSLLATKASLPLGRILSELLVESDNNTAELLLKHLARPPGGAKITRKQGTAALRETLTGARLPVGELTAVDGSGLDRANRASCRLLLRALGPTDDFVTYLPRAGETGTLFDRFRDHPLEGRLAAKTGALAGVVGLVGYTDATSEPPKLRFAFLVNGSFSEPAGRQLQERLGTVLAGYPESPSASAIAP